MTIDTATGEAAPAELSSERVYDIFSSIAKKYQRFNAISSFGLYKGWLRTMIDMAPITSTSKVLDIAGGTGDVSFTAARMKHPAHILLTDLVPEMLEVAKRHYVQGAAQGVPVDFAVVDGQDIPYENDSFDVITMAYGIRNMPDRTLALQEMLRVLKPGGTLVCLEFSTPTNAIIQTLYRPYLTFMIPFWGGLITGNKEGFLYLRDSIKAFPDQKAFGEMLSDAGFEQINWKNKASGIAAIHTAVKPSQSASGPRPTPGPETHTKADGILER